MRFKIRRVMLLFMHFNLTLLSFHTPFEIHVFVATFPKYTDKTERENYS
jgi:hypothetical protein